MCIWRILNYLNVMGGGGERILNDLNIMASATKRQTACLSYTAEYH